MAISTVRVCLKFKLKGGEVRKKKITENEFFDNLEQGEKFDIDSCQKHLELIDYLDVPVESVEWIELKLLNDSTNRSLIRTHKIWNKNSLVNSKWFTGARLEESEMLINLERDGEQRSLKLSNFEENLIILSDVVITKDEELINMLEGDQ